MHIVKTTGYHTLPAVFLGSVQLLLEVLGEDGAVVVAVRLLEVGGVTDVLQLEEHVHVLQNHLQGAEYIGEEHVHVLQYHLHGDEYINEEHIVHVLQYHLQGVEYIGEEHVHVLQNHLQGAEYIGERNLSTYFSINILQGGKHLSELIAYCRPKTILTILLNNKNNFSFNQLAHSRMVLISGCCICAL